jgi:hypothetical protein
MKAFNTTGSYDPLKDNTYMSGEMKEYFKNQLTRLHEKVLKKEVEKYLNR